MMHELRKRVPFEEFDYQVLLDSLKDYKKPRDKISGLLKRGDIIRVKKGLYVFGDDYRKGPISLEVLANLIYGPSYISREYALSYYGLIPEAVYLVTSMTLGKNKWFETPVGNFDYHALKQERYRIGIQLEKVDERRHVLIASKEKALADLIYLTPKIDTVDEMREHLIENLRMENLQCFKKREMKEIAEAYQHSNVDLLLGAL